MSASLAGIGLSVMNPPKGSKKKKPASPAQRAWRKKFAERFGKKKNKKSGGGSSSSSKSKGRPVSSSKKKGSSAGGSGKKKKGRRFSSAGGMFKDLTMGGVSGALMGGAGLAGFWGVSKVPDLLPASWVKDSAGQISTARRFVIKSALAVGMYVPTRIAGNFVGGKTGQIIKAASEGLLAGSIVNIGFDALATAVPSAKPRTLTGLGDAEDGEMGQYVYQQLTEAAPAVGGRLGQYVNADPFGN